MTIQRRISSQSRLRSGTGEQAGAFLGNMYAHWTLAKEQWEYAALSENAYREGRGNVRAKRDEFVRSLTYGAQMTQAALQAACTDHR